MEQSTSSGMDSGLLFQSNTFAESEGRSACLASKHVSYFLARGEAGGSVQAVGNKLLSVHSCLRA